MNYSNVLLIDSSLPDYQVFVESANANTFPIVYSSSTTRDEYSLSALLGLKGFFVKQYIQALQRYSFSDIEKVLLLLSHYNLLSVGIGRVNADDATLMKEMVTKIISKDV